MITKQKKTLKHCLTIGTFISIFGLLILARCANVDYIIEVDFIFINNTSKKINYSDIFELIPNSQYDYNITPDGADKNPNINTCCEGVLDGFHGDYYQVYLILDDSLCVFFEKDVGPTTLSNFESRKISDRHFEYTYTFMEKEFEGAVKCGE